MGETLYIGSRRSDQFGRLYDKAAEEANTALFGRKWRYEVEYKDRRAQNVMKALIEPEKRVPLPALIQNAVWWWFDERNIPPLFDRAYNQRVAFETSGKITDTSRQLTWLTKQVQPTVKRLLAQGEEDAVWAALGLTPPEFHGKLDLGQVNQK